MWEAQAITLAIELKARLLIIDERKGREVAKEYGLKIIGILGILGTAKQKGLIPEIKPYIDQLKDKIGFRVSERLYDLILKDAGEV